MEPLRRTAPRNLEFGIYRDGDNNLDVSQSAVLRQARSVSERDRSIEFTVEDTSSGVFHSPVTERSTIADGREQTAGAIRGDDMASPKNLAAFVARTLDNAERSGAKQTWIELVDHGAGDGGGLEADSFKQLMPMPQIAEAIADGIALHAKSHPEDAARNIDGVVANQCLMASLGFADALSHAGVRWLAASPETMVSPGVPSSVAGAIARNIDSPGAMARAIVSETMQQTYGAGAFSWKPAAAFDVLDLAAEKRRAVERDVKALNDAIAARTSDGQTISALRDDASGVQGMVRFPEATADMPWHADRPASELFGKFARDARLDPQLRGAAARAERSVRNLVLAHGESSSFAPFGGADYRDAAGPTVHFPVTQRSVDPWAPRVTETHNAFFAETDAAAAERALA